MKKHILLQLLFLLGILISHEAISKNTKPIKHFYFKLTSALNLCESGSGICFVYLGSSSRTVEAEITLLEKQIQFNLQRASMSEELERELMQKSRFSIDVETILPMDITRYLRQNTSIEIIPGYYPIEIHDNFITITCDFK